jgi:predicted O-methyltransferase YrrM
MRNNLARIHGKIDDLVKDVYFGTSHLLHKRLNKEKHKEAEEVLRRYRREGSTLRHRYQEYKLVSLISLLNDVAPKTILELGAGSTTAIFANYIRRVPGTRLSSVDEHNWYLDQARRVAEVEKLDSRFTFICLPQKLIRNDLGVVEGAKYDGELIDRWDFIFIDGPSAWEGKNKNKQAISCNVFDLLDRYRPQTIVVDGRRATVKALIEYLSPEEYDHYPTDLMSGDIRVGYRYFSYFRRRG